MSVTVVVVDPAFEADAALVLGSEALGVEELVGEGAVEALGFARLKIASVVGHATDTSVRLWLRTVQPGRYSLLVHSLEETLRAHGTERALGVVPLTLEEAQSALPRRSTSPGHTPAAAATKQHSPAWPASPHSKRPPGKTPATASTAAATANSTAPCTPSPSPAAATAPTPRPTSPNEPPKAKPPEKPNAASNATSPARSTASSNTPQSTLDKHRSIGWVCASGWILQSTSCAHPAAIAEPAIECCAGACMRPRAGGLL